jgi:hypothetical protein
MRGKLEEGCYRSASLCPNRERWRRDSVPFVWVRLLMRSSPPLMGQSFADPSLMLACTNRFRQKMRASTELGLAQCGVP